MVDLVHVQSLTVGLVAGLNMITPTFNLEQSDEHLIIQIHAPYTNAKDTEIDVNNDCVIFYSTPYYLRLKLPGNVEETDGSSANYNASEGKYIIKLNKVTRGENFPNLDALTSLLQPKTRSTRVKPLSDVISENVVRCNSFETEEITEDDWFIEQVVDVEMSSEPSSSSTIHAYGFLNSHSGLKDKYSSELSQGSEIENPDNVPELERRKQRIETEQKKFSSDHYLADFMENEEVADALQFTFDTNSLQSLSQRNLKTLEEIGHKEVKIDSKLWQKRIYLGLVDILYAYCYDWRITEGSHCCESAWNISKLSGTLSWFDVFESITDVIHSCMRRSLSYPLLRHWQLSRKVWRDTVKVLKSGPTGILICLLDIHNVFRKKEPYYLLNQLYIEQYCVWIRSMEPESKALQSIVVATEKGLESYEKGHVGFDLVELESAALACEDEAMEDEISETVRNVNIT